MGPRNRAKAQRRRVRTRGHQRLQPAAPRRAGAAVDGYVFVAPEYNHGISGALKNAIDFLFAEWNNKAAGFVSYGSVGGARAVEHLRLIMGELMVATVRQQISLSMHHDFENFRIFKPGPQHQGQL